MCVTDRNQFANMEKFLLSFIGTGLVSKLAQEFGGNTAFDNVKSSTINYKVMKKRTTDTFVAPESNILIAQGESKDFDGESKININYSSKDDNHTIENKIFNHRKGKQN